MSTVVPFIERATNDMLIGPDWAINMEICDLINIDPSQAKDAIKTIKKRLTNKNSNVQILSLTVLETVSKNCGDNVLLQIIERDMLSDLVKIVKKKPDLGVREKILALLDAWQEAFGTTGKYPQFSAAYQDLKNAGVVFPQRAESSVPLFTPPESTQQHSYHPPTFESSTTVGSLHSDPFDLSLEEIQNAKSIAEVLLEMLNAMGPDSSKDIQQEVIVDLVEQCRNYLKRVMVLIESTSDEGILSQGLFLNDELQRALTKHDDIARGLPSIRPEAVIPSLSPVNVDQEDESEDDFSHLARRPLKESLQGKGKSSIARDELRKSNLILPPPPAPSQRRTTSSTLGVPSVDYLSGEAYQREASKEQSYLAANKSSSTTYSNPVSVPGSSSSAPPQVREPDLANPYIGRSESDEVPEHSEKTSASSDMLPTSLPPPPAKHNQRQQFFEQQHLKQQYYYGSESSSDGLADKAGNLTLSSSGMEEPKPPAKLEKPDDPFKDLFDLAKAKSSPKKSKSPRKFSGQF